MMLACWQGLKRLMFVIWVADALVLGFICAKQSGRLMLMMLACWALRAKGL